MGVNITRMNLNFAGNGIMIGWAIWIVIFIVTAEILDLVFKDKKRNGLNQFKILMN